MSASISEESVFGMSSRLAIVGCLGRSLGQMPTSAKSESDWIQFVTPCHRKETDNLAGLSLVLGLVEAFEEFSDSQFVELRLRWIERTGADIPSRHPHTLSLYL